MLVDECEKGNVAFRLRSEALSGVKDDTGLHAAELNGMTVGCEKLVIVTGGLSMPGWAHRRLVMRLPNNSASSCCRPVWVWCHSLCIKPLLEELQVLAGGGAFVIPLKTVRFP